MFASIESFSIFFFTALAICLSLIIFEDKLVAFEEKCIAKRQAKKRREASKKYTNIHLYPNKNIKRNIHK